MIKKFLVSVLVSFCLVLTISFVADRHRANKEFAQRNAVALAWAARVYPGSTVRCEQFSSSCIVEPYPGIRVPVRCSATNCYPGHF